MKIFKLLFLVFILGLIISGEFFYVSKHFKTRTNAVSVISPKPQNMCQTNTYNQEIIVSISRRHLWACNYTSQIVDSSVITGNMNLASDLTPVGTYRIYSKITGYRLIGSNGVTSWNDYVNYWMPFLQNQYGIYGFHDATWRSPGDFGNISPYSSQASHGCVELPLSVAKTLYGWASVGATVSIIS